MAQAATLRGLQQGAGAELRGPAHGSTWAQRHTGRRDTGARTRGGLLSERQWESAEKGVGEKTKTVGRGSGEKRVRGEKSAAGSRCCEKVGRRKWAENGGEGKKTVENKTLVIKRMGRGREESGKKTAPDRGCCEKVGGHGKKTVSGEENGGGGARETVVGKAPGEDGEGSRQCGEKVGREHGGEKKKEEGDAGREKRGKKTLLQEEGGEMEPEEDGGE